MDKKQQYFNSIGDDWDRDLTAEDLERLSHIIDKVDIPPGVNVCDLGCGTGVLFDLLRRRVGETGYIVGIDFAPRVVHKARRNFPFHNIGVVEADACCLPFRDDTFDLVISFAAFAHFSHKDQTIRQAQMMLKPGGRIIIIHLHGRTELARLHHQAGGPINRDELPDRNELEEMFDRGRFSRFELTETKDLYLAVGFKE
jgi:demethylmenaquinone methyltransferase/2-methoxy-6-polyprenyl-1,4-benzoquinol methylase